MDTSALLAVVDTVLILNAITALAVLIFGVQTLRWAYNQIIYFIGTDIEFKDGDFHIQSREEFFDHRTNTKNGLVYDSDTNEWLDPNDPDSYDFDMSDDPRFR